MAIDAVKNTEHKMASIPGAVAEAAKKRTKENQTKGERKDLGLQAPWAHMATHQQLPSSKCHDSQFAKPDITFGVPESQAAK